MAGLEVNIEHIEQQTIYGLWKKSNDKTISKDIKALSNQYHTAVSMPEKRLLPYFVLSRNYNNQSRDFELFIGSVIDKGGLDSLAIPAGEHAKITIKPKLGFLWGPSIGEAKQYFYTKWLPASPFDALNMEYEYHTERSAGKQPTIDIIFAVSRKIVDQSKGPQDEALSQALQLKYKEGNVEWRRDGFYSMELRHCEKNARKWRWSMTISGFCWTI